MARSKYGAGEQITLQMHLSAAVVVEAAYNLSWPFLQLEASGIRRATYVEGSGTTMLR